MHTLSLPKMSRLGTKGQGQGQQPGFRESLETHFDFTAFFQMDYFIQFNGVVLLNS